MISFKPFFEKLYLDEVSTYKLIKEHNISSSTINRLKHNKPVSTATVEKLCEVLNCDVYDILEFKPDKKN
ncbi:MAG: helix-turn-helix transcriptional regulator [Oscillospiraceae bacterium]|nr:helix-turn-helix transcriptional regulator [Oscillospiraceae bacterium]